MVTQRSIVVCIVASLSLLAGVSEAAVIVDLTAEGYSGTINGATFVQFNPAKSTGTGVIDSFVRIQGNGTERGYNTDGTPEFQTKTGSFTHSETVGGIPTVVYAGVLCWEFLLDINETGGSNSKVSLDELKIYVENGPNLDSYPGSFTNLAYDMNAGGGGNWVRMDADLNSGSGSGDMLVYVPVGSFGSDPGKNLYLYSSFGTNIASDDGFEEWAHGVGGTLLPEPATLGVLAIGGVLNLLRRRRAA